MSDPSDLLHARVRHHRLRDDRGRVVIPERLGWWAQLQRERMCRRMHGHCFHAHLFTFWNCCMCGQVAEGFIGDGCHYCPKGTR